MTTSLFIRDEYGNTISWLFLMLIICLNSHGVPTYFNDDIYIFAKHQSRTHKYSSTQHYMMYNTHMLAGRLEIYICNEYATYHKLNAQQKYVYNMLSICTICIRSPIDSLNITSHNVYHILLHPSSRFEPTCSSMHQVCQRKQNLIMEHNM